MEHLLGYYVDYTNALQLQRGSFIKDRVVQFRVCSTEIFAFRLLRLQQCDGGFNLLYLRAIRALRIVAPEELIESSVHIANCFRADHREDVADGLMDSIALYSGEKTTTTADDGDDDEECITKTSSSRLLDLHVNPILFAHVAAAIRGQSLYRRFLHVPRCASEIIRVRKLATRLGLLGTVDASLQPLRLLHPAFVVRDLAQVGTESNPIPLISVQGAIPHFDDSQVSSADPVQALGAFFVDSSAVPVPCDAAAQEVPRLVVSAEVVNQWVSKSYSCGRLTWRFTIVKAGGIGIGVGLPAALRSGSDPRDQSNLTAYYSDGRLHNNFSAHLHIVDTQLPFGQGAVIRVTVDFATRYVVFERGRRQVKIVRFTAPTVAAFVTLRQGAVVECVLCTLDGELRRADAFTHA